MGQSEKPSSSTFPWKEILTFLGVAIVAYFGYLGVRSQIEIPIHATQTAEARLTEFAVYSTMTQTANLLPPTSTYTPVSILTTTPTLTLTPIPTATAKSLSIVGKWEGTTTGINNGNPISERATTVSIPLDCQLGKDCGFFTTEGACTYQMTLVGIQNNVFELESISISGADFCYSINGNSEKDNVTITLVSDNEILFHYETQSSVVMREGTLIKQ